MNSKSYFRCENGPAASQGSLFKLKTFICTNAQINRSKFCFEAVLWFTRNLKSAAIFFLPHFVLFVLVNSKVNDS